MPRWGWLWRWAGGSRAFQTELADFTRDVRVLMLAAMALVIGVISALVAYALVWLIGLITNLAYYQRFSAAFVSPDGARLGYFAVLVPVLGGLVVGWMARYGSEKIRGHGIPEALEAILVGGSRMDVKVAILKPLSSAISIGTGGPFGAEGPIIMTGGAFGSLFAQFFPLSAAERRTLLVAGAAGGMAAIFASPLAATLLAVELLLFEWRPRSFVPVALAASVAAALRRPLLGAGPIFPVVVHQPLAWQELAAAFACGLVAGGVSSLMTGLVYGCEDLFGKLSIHWMWWPAIGGVLVGVGGLWEPRALGVGYDVIHDLLGGRIVGAALLGLLVVKALIWAIALGSGTSGGVLAPLLIMGGAVGAIEAACLPFGDVSLWVMVSMSAVMAGVMRSPLTGIVFTLELTYDFNVLPCLLLACLAADAVTVLWMRRSILTEKLSRRGYHLMREYTVDPFLLVQVGEVMDRQPPRLPAAMSIAEISQMIAAHDPALARAGVPLVDEQGRLAGIITRKDVLRALKQGVAPSTPLLETGSRDLIVTYPDELVYQAAAKMIMNHIGRLPVVSRSDPRQLAGYLGRAEVMAARMRKFTEEESRERLFNLRWPWAQSASKGQAPPVDGTSGVADALPGKGKEGSA